jgi:hypothetical protein
MKALAALTLFLFFFSFAGAATIEEIYWEPENPQPGDDITVYAIVSGNVTQVRYQYCIGEACFPGNMEKNGDVWTFVIPGSDVKEGKIDVNVTVTDENGAKIYMEKEIEIKKESSSTPGFEMLAAMAAMAAVLLIKVKSGKKIR